MKKAVLSLMLACVSVYAMGQLRVLPHGNLLTGSLRFSQGIEQPVVPLSNNGSETVTQDTIYNRDASIHFFSPSTTGVAFAAFGIHGMTVGESAAGRKVMQRSGYGPDAIALDNIGTGVYIARLQTASAAKTLKLMR